MHAFSVYGLEVVSRVWVGAGRVLAAGGSVTLRLGETGRTSEYCERQVDTIVVGCPAGCTVCALCGCVLPCLFMRNDGGATEAFMDTDVEGVMGFKIPSVSGSSSHKIKRVIHMNSDANG